MRAGFWSHLTVTLFVSLCATTAQASLVVHWAFDDPHPVISQTETIELNATIYNDISSDQILGGGNQPITGNVGGIITGTGYSWGTLAYDATYAPYNPYDVSLGTHPLMPDDLMPGESYSFVFRILTPHSGSVHPVWYTFSPYITVITNNLGTKYFAMSPDSPLVLTVSSVPLPTSLWLLASGLFSLISGRKIMKG